VGFSFLNYPNKSHILLYKPGQDAVIYRKDAYIIDNRGPEGERLLLKWKLRFGEGKSQPVHQYILNKFIGDNLYVDLQYNRLYAGHCCHETISEKGKNYGH
jgi:hypothetical protein